MFCWARTAFIAVVVILGSISMLGACGQKGPLYLPDEKPAKKAPAGSDVPEVKPAAQTPKTQSPSH